ncbi:MAG: FecR domain-containing protein [Candidatus Omnitrophica bacterium]|nr:FecR domain-containing protein [Candidatus Omnitrophota bacterium]
MPYMRKQRSQSLLVTGTLLTFLFFITPSGFAQHAGMTAPLSDSAQKTDTAVKDQITKTENTQEKSLMDHKALIFNVSGETFILRKGDSSWKPMAKDDMISEGDQIKTGKDSFVEISYDEFYLNIARIGANTIAEFRSIEPTDIFISDGGIFNNLEGLTKGSTYEVATPTSVAGVRGTEFLRSFDAQTQTDMTICDRGAVEVFPITPNGDLIREAGVQVTGGNSFEINPEKMAAITEKNFDAVKPVEMTPEQAQMMGQMADSAKENLTGFVGNPEAIQIMHEKFKEEILKNPEKMAAVMNEMREKDREFFGPGGPNGPNSGGPNHPNDPNNPNNGINPKTMDPKMMDSRMMMDPKAMMDPTNFDPKNFDPKGNLDPQNFDPKNFDSGQMPNLEQNQNFEHSQENFQRDYNAWGKENFTPQESRGPSASENRPDQPQPTVQEMQHMQEQMRQQMEQYAPQMQQMMQQQMQEQMQQMQQQQNLDNRIQYENRIQEITTNSAYTDYCQKNPGAEGCH